MTTEEKKLSTAYQESEAVKAAKAQLDQQLSAKPGAYQSPWQSQLDDALTKLQNREKFQYDINGDAIYQQYKDRAVQQGRQAMMDTMAKASALTGGYGNSYAQMAGQQAYQGQLQGLNDMIPELAQLARSMYDADTNLMLNQYGLLADQEEKDYGRHRDTVADWQTEANRLQGFYNSERELDYGKFIDDRNYQYQVGRDAVADKQWQAEFDEAKRQYDEQYGSSSGGSGGSGGGYYSVDGAVESYENLDLKTITQLYEDFSGLSTDEALRRAALIANQGGYDPSIMAGIANDATGAFNVPGVVDTTVPQKVIKKNSEGKQPVTKKRTVV